MYGVPMPKTHQATKASDLPPPHRAVHLVDVENLLGSSATDEATVAQLRARYEVVSGMGADDHVVIATGSCAAAAAWYGWGPARRLLRRGVNGADQALLGVIEGE